MRKVALLYNPASGPYQRRRMAVLEQVLTVLRSAGIEAESLATHAPGSASRQVREAIEQDCDTILACGGDGTIHEALQALVGTDVALGVVPMGTANALACDLGLPRNPVKAVEMLLKAEPVAIPVGRVSYQSSDGTEKTRYFTVAAGVGADAHLMYRLDAKLKRRFGYALYLVEALRIWFTHSFPFFEARITAADGKSSDWKQYSQLLVVRISDFGGILHHLIPGAALRNSSLRLVAFKTRSRWRYLRFTTAVLFGRQGSSSAVEILDANSIECRIPKDSKASLFVEADGELLGGLPVRFEVASETLTVLMQPVSGK